jgi:hypothetical protein
MGSPEAIERRKRTIRESSVAFQIRKVRESRKADIPDRPTPEADRDRLVMNMLISRLQSQAIRGGGVGANIRTSPLGVTQNAALLRRGLKGA